MLIWKKILWLRERVQEQKKWIDSCGGTLAGYIEKYGDPGVPPRDQEGIPQTVLIPENEPEIAATLIPVPDQPGLFYKPHMGDGGTAIYQADLTRLRSWEQELFDLEIRCPAARVKADDEQQARPLTPEQLATGAHQALDHFVALGLACGGDNTDEKLVDFLSALHHLCDRYEFSWENLLRKADRLYHSDLKPPLDTETSGERS